MLAATRFLILILKIGLLQIIGICKRQGNRNATQEDISALAAALDKAFKINPKCKQLRELEGLFQ